jgi:hypothetical protein
MVCVVTVSEHEGLKLERAVGDQIYDRRFDSSRTAEPRQGATRLGTEWILVPRVRDWVGRSAVGPIRLGRETSPARTRLLYAWDPTPQTAAKNAWSVPPRPSSDCVCSTMAGP